MGREEVEVKEEEGKAAEANICSRFALCCVEGVARVMGESGGVSIC